MERILTRGTQLLIMRRQKEAQKTVQTSVSAIGEPPRRMRGHVLEIKLLHAATNVVGWKHECMHYTEASYSETP